MKTEISGSEGERDKDMLWRQQLAASYRRNWASLVQRVERKFPKLGAAGAEDIVQGAYREALNHHRIDPEFWPDDGWFSLAVRHRAIDEVRSRARMVDPPAGWNSSNPSDWIAWVDWVARSRKQTVDPEAKALGEVWVEQVLELLKIIIPDETDRACVALKFLEYEEREIAAMLSLSYQRREVQTRIRRVERLLRKRGISPDV